MYIYSVGVVALVCITMVSHQNVMGLFYQIHPLGNALDYPYGNNLKCFCFLQMCFSSHTILLVFRFIRRFSSNLALCLLLLLLFLFNFIILSFYTIIYLYYYCGSIQVILDFTNSFSNFETFVKFFPHVKNVQISFLIDKKFLLLFAIKVSCFSVEDCEVIEARI